MTQELGLLLDGKVVAGDLSLDVINPASAQPFVTVARASEAQAGAAVAAAKRAFPGWSALSREERVAYLARLADAIEANAPRLAKLITQEQGKPLGDSQFEVAFAVTRLRDMASAHLPVEVVQDDENTRVEIHYRPLGVVAAISPWNFPFLLSISKVGPALVLGNTVVLKPAPTTPAAILAMGELAADILPAGVLNVIVDENDLGGYLTSHPDVAKISFTGSTVTGKKVAASAADTLKRITLELGGNDAGVVLDDVDVKKTAASLAEAAFRNAGQICIALKRLYVPGSIYDEMCDELATQAGNVRYGDGLQQGVTMGPLQNAQQFAKAKVYLEAARRDGTVIAGGSVGEGDGYFIEPTVVRDISDGSPLVDEEQFAPILPVIRYDDLDTVIERANDSKMGLGGSVWSASVERAYDTARRIDSGTVWINQHAAGGHNIPFGGAKESGIGVENSDLGLAEYMQRTVINIKKG